MANLLTGSSIINFYGLIGRSVVLQPDGKILLGGRSYNGTNEDFALVRCNPDGSLDTTFSSDGKLSTDFGYNDSAYSLALQSLDNKILLGGYSYNSNSSSLSFALARYNSDGTLDNSFSGDGLLIGDLGSGNGSWFVTTQTNGKILFAGSVSGINNYGSDIELIRYNTDGNLDTTFSNDGKVTTNISVVDEPRSIAIQSDGKILVGGDSLQYGFAVVRYNTDGSLDNSFDYDGIATTFIPNHTAAYGSSIALQSDGKILLGGYSARPSDSGFEFCLSRFNTNGSLDTTFGNSGIVTTDFLGSNDDILQSIAIQKDGKIVAVGHGTNVNDFIIARYNSNGTLDNSFSGDGKITDNYDGRWAESVTIQPDNKILVGGSNILVRYNSDGSLDTTFSGIDNSNTQALTTAQNNLLASLKSNFDSSISHITYDATANTASYSGMPASLYGECVSYVKNARIDLRGGSLNTDISWGNATGGPQTFTRLGFHVDDAIPMIGSAFVITAGNAGADKNLGHTGIVRDVTVERVFTRGVLQYQYKLELRDSNGSGTHKMADYTKYIDFPKYGNGWQFIWGTNTEYTQDKTAIQTIISKLYDNQLLDQLITKQTWLDDFVNNPQDDIEVQNVSNVKILLNRFFLLNTQDKFTNFLNLIELHQTEMKFAFDLHSLAVSNLTNDVLAGAKVGTSADDTMTGSSGNDLFIGGAGNDTLTGNGGNNTFKFVTFDGGGTDTITDFVSGTDKIEIVAENFGLNPINPVILNTSFNGTTPQFTYNSNTGELWFDRDGTDSQYNAAHMATLTGSKTFTASDIRVLNANIYTGEDKGGGEVVNTIIDTTGLNQLTGSEQNDVLKGLDGNDSLNALGGDDTLDGGTGVDTMDGGDGNDIYIVDNIRDSVFERYGDSVAGVDEVQSLVSYTLSTNIENLTLKGTDIINATGNALNNILSGNESANTLDGKAGVDTMDGGDANDIYIVDNISDVVSEVYGDALAGIDTVKSSVDYSLSDNIENLTLTGTTAINATGNALNNTLTGNSIANSLDGGLGADKLLGGAGNDSYYVDNVGDKITESSTLSTEIDEVYSLVNYTLPANVEKLNLIGATAINGTGNALNNSLTGNDAANVLNGNAGVDTLIGGLGNDTYYVDNAGDSIIESSILSTEIDKVYSSSLNYTLTANIENLILTGTTAINGVGNSLNNIITGNSAANILTGGLGQDKLTGGLGADSFKLNAITETGISATTRDIITDFKTSELDKIDLSAIDADSVATGNNDFATLTVGIKFLGTFTNQKDLYFDSTSHILYGNNDSDASADFSILLSGVSALTKADLVL